MHANLEKITELLKSLEIDDDIQRQLNCAISQTDKTILKLDFRQKRSSKDREIAINLLNKTIEDLEKQQNLLAQSNEQLILQKKLVEEQSETLKEHLNKLEISYHELEQFS